MRRRDILVVLQGNKETKIFVSWPSVSPCACVISCNSNSGYILKTLEIFAMDTKVSVACHRWETALPGLLGCVCVCVRART